MKFFLDTYALIEIAKGNAKFERYLNSDAVTLKDNLAELFYFYLREYNEKTAHSILNKYSRIAGDLPLTTIPKAMKFKHTHKKERFSYIDCLGYAYALENNRFFLTGDRAFSGLKNVELVR